jgi:hypothetical protein
MTLDDARKNLHTWLDDLSALRPFCDPNNPDMANFLAAWNTALKKAKDAAKQYADAVGP